MENVPIQREAYLSVDVAHGIGRGPLPEKSRPVPDLDGLVQQSSSAYRVVYMFVGLSLNELCQFVEY